jgi:16S rRNA (cytosine967-C5)-methyltransferase
VTGDGAVSPARRAAYEVLRRTFEEEAWTDRALRSAVERHGLSGSDAGLARRLAYGAVKRRATTDAFIDRLAKRPERLDPPVRAALRLGLYELLLSGTAADHAAVGEAVELAKGGVAGAAGGERARAGSGLVNAVLRRASRERADLLGGLDDSTPEGAAVAHSYPPWLATMWWEELGPDVARAVMAAMNGPAEIAFRVNTLRSEPGACAAGLRAAGVDVTVGDGRSLLDPVTAIVIAGGGAAVEARVAAGELIPQSRASQAVVAVLDPRPGERQLDLCSGPGIKSSQIAAASADEGEIVSVELDARRGREVDELCRRAGAASVRTVIADAATADLDDGYDRALVDPPCSDLGTLASRPDARWRKSPELIGRLADLQGRILDNAAAAVQPGGTVVYSTCTISARENREVVDAVLGRNPGLDADDLGAEHPALASVPDARFLQTRPDRDGTAGFFIARLRRRA